MRGEGAKSRGGRGGYRGSIVVEPVFLLYPPGSGRLLVVAQKGVPRGELLLSLSLLRLIFPVFLGGCLAVFYRA